MNPRITLAVAASLALHGCSATEELTCDDYGQICTVVGVPQQAMLGLDGVPADESPTYLPQDISFRSDGVAFFPDFNNHRVRMIDNDGIVTTVSGTGFLGDGPEGPSNTFAWNHPTMVLPDPVDPNLIHVAAWHNSRIHLIDLAQNTTSFACAASGKRDYAGDGGMAIDAVLDLPSSLAFDDEGNIYISDQANQAIRRIDSSGIIETIAGSPGEDFAAEHNSNPDNEPIEDATTGYTGDGGPAVDALLFAEVGQQAEPSSKLTISGNTLYIADSGNNVIRTIDLATMTIDRFAGVPWTRSTEDDMDAPADLTAGDGGPALDAVLNNPRDVAVGLSGEVYIADTDNHCVRVVYPDGLFETFAGQCGAEPMPGDKFKGENQPALEARLWSPYGVAVDNDGHVYIADTKNHVIRRVAVGAPE